MYKNLSTRVIQGSVHLNKIMKDIREKRKKYNLQSIFLRFLIMNGIFFSWYYGIYKRENAVKGLRIPNTEITFLAFFLVYINLFSIVIHFTKIIFPSEEHVKSSKFVIYIVEVLTQFGLVGPLLFSLFDVYQLDRNMPTDGLQFHSNGLCLINNKHMVLPGSAYIQIDNVTDFAHQMNLMKSTLNNLDIYIIPYIILLVLYICELLLQNTSMRYELQIHHYLVMVIYYIQAYTEASLVTFRIGLIEMLFQNLEFPLFIFLIYYRLKIVSSEPKETPLLVWKNMIIFITFVCVWWALTRTILIIWTLYEYIVGYDYLPFEAKVLWLIVLVLQSVTLGFTQKSVMGIRSACIRKMKRAYFPENNNAQHESIRFNWQSRRDLVSTRNIDVNQ